MGRMPGGGRPAGQVCGFMVEGSRHASIVGDWGWRRD